MGKRIRKHVKFVLPLKKPKQKEELYTHSVHIPLNIAQTDRISFSVLRNNKNKIRKVENISFEISVHDKWEWVVRYDDHGGIGLLHRHYRLSLEDHSEIESSTGINERIDKNNALTWVCADIRRNYLRFRTKFLKSLGLDLY